MQSKKAIKSIKLKENLAAYVRSRAELGFSVDESILDHLNETKSARHDQDLDILLTYASDIALSADFN